MAWRFAPAYASYILVFLYSFGIFSPLSRGRFRAQTPHSPYGECGGSRRGLRQARFLGGGLNSKASSGAPRSQNPALGHHQPPRVVTRGRDDAAGGFRTVLRDLAVGIPFPAVVVIAGITRGEPSCEGVGRMAHGWGGPAGATGPVSESLLSDADVSERPSATPDIPSSEGTLGRYSPPTCAM